LTTDGRDGGAVIAFQDDEITGAASLQISLLLRGQLLTALPSLPSHTTAEPVSDHLGDGLIVGQHLGKFSHDLALVELAADFEREGKDGSLEPVSWPGVDADGVLAPVRCAWRRRNRYGFLCCSRSGSGLSVGRGSCAALRRHQATFTVASSASTVS
jgi:hypothetical protein